MPPPRRLSNSSESSICSSRSSSPNLAGLDSSSALILVHDPEENNTPLDFSSDDDGDNDNIDSPQFELRRASIPSLGPTVVFLYLLTPYLKLGAMFLPHIELPLKYGLAPLLIFAVLSAFARQIWYMLARYMRTADLEDIILDAFARGRGKERRRGVLRSTVRAGTGTLRLLLATIYLRESVHVLLPLFSGSWPKAARPVLTVVLALAVLPLSLAQSLTFKRVVYATWFSLVTYVVWLGCVAYAHSQGTLPLNAGWLKMGTFWQGITTIAFAFTSSSTLPLYASLKGSRQPITTVKPSRARSFNSLSALSVAVAVSLTLPLVIFSAYPNIPATLSSSRRLDIAVPILNAATLLLGIPPIIITTPSLPIPERIRHATTIPISKSLLSLFVITLALAPSRASSVLSDILLLSALSSTYFLPALVHITAHFFKRPLAIVMPQIPGSPAHPHRAHEGSSSPRLVHDELLMRKERALQRRQFRKRIVWDVGVWVLLVGGGAGFVWAAGRTADKW